MKDENVLGSVRGTPIYGNCQTTLLVATLTPSSSALCSGMALNTRNAPEMLD